MKYNIGGIRTDACHVAAAVAASATVTSEAFSGLGSCENVSIFVTTTVTGTVSLAFSIITSVDGTTFVAPESGSAIKSGVTATGSFHAAISVPLSRQYKIKIVESAAAGGSAVVTATVAKQ